MSRPTNYVETGRVRTIKPQFFLHEGLFDLERQSGLPVRLGFAGLWTCCDREGRFLWRPRMLKVRILPYDVLDFAPVLHALATRGCIVPYLVNGDMFGYIPSWHQHQVINHREQAAILPAPTPETEQAARLQLDLQFDACPTREPRVPDAPATVAPPVPDDCPTRHDPARGEGKGREGNTELPKAGSSVTAPVGDASATRAPRVSFQKPTLEQVAAYCRERGNHISPRQWLDHYESNGWKVGRNPMRDWKAAVRTWEQSEIGSNQPLRRRGPDPHVGAHPPAAAEAATPHDPLPEGLDEPAGREQWGKAQRQLAQALNRHSWETWLKPLRSAGRKNGTLYLLVPSDDFKQAFEKYRPATLQALAEYQVRDVVLLY